MQRQWQGEPDAVVTKLQTPGTGQTVQQFSGIAVPVKGKPSAVCGQRGQGGYSVRLS